MNFVLIDVQDTWSGEFAEAGEDYPDADLVLFRNAVNTGCGGASSATGPFYCPLDQKVYVDLGFFEELRSQFGAPGDFAQAYVLAHEIGHHVQNVLGINPEVRRAPTAAARSGQRVVDSPGAAGRLPGRHLGPRRPSSATCSRRATSKRASPPPRRSATTASSRRPAAAVNPETWTHGSSEQRIRWFQVGLRHAATATSATRSAWRRTSSEGRASVGPGADLGDGGHRQRPVEVGERLHRGGRPPTGSPTRSPARGR